MRLKGKTVLVTGGSSGIGKAIALAFAKEGADVAVSYRTSQQGARQVVQAIIGMGRKALAVNADVTNEEEVREMVETTIKEFGRIDVLVSNAGVTDQESQLIRDLRKEIWDHIVTTNLTGTFLCSKAVLLYMISWNHGNIIIISSGLGQPGLATLHRFFGAAAYIASKHGIEGFREALALEVEQYNINVNTLYPEAQVNTGFFDHLPEEDRAKLVDPRVICEPAIMLASQGKGGLTNESISARQWHKEHGTGVFDQYEQP